uniref:Protein preY, mitochondrial n=1 Tax=Globisporangium ultimum (strain ATCC 200006 / CBS 805.95 / DAOM BR144) TaxID=431595 RepID=K3WH27_GLOUD
MAARAVHRASALVARTNQPRSTLRHMRSMGATSHDGSSLPALHHERLVDESILEHIVCPISKFPLRYDTEGGALICDEIRVAYPIRYGAPMLVPSEARILNEDEQQ